MHSLHKVKPALEVILPFCNLADTICEQLSSALYVMLPILGYVHCEHVVIRSVLATHAGLTLSSPEFRCG